MYTNVTITLIYCLLYTVYSLHIHRTFYSTVVIWYWQGIQHCERATKPSDSDWPFQSSSTAFITYILDEEIGNG